MNPGLFGAGDECSQYRVVIRELVAVENLRIEVSRAKQKRAYAIARVPEVVKAADALHDEYMTRRKAVWAEARRLTK